MLSYKLFSYNPKIPPITSNLVLYSCITVNKEYVGLNIGLNIDLNIGMNIDLNICLNIGLKVVTFEVWTNDGEGKEHLDIRTWVQMTGDLP